MNCGTLLGIVIGGFFSWFFTKLYFKKSSQEQKQSFHELKELVQQAVTGGHLDPCRLIGIGQYKGEATFYDVMTTINFSSKSLKNVGILVILYDHDNIEIDRGIGVIPEILSGKSGYVRVILNNKKGDFCDHSKISITNCHLS